MIACVCGYERDARTSDCGYSRSRQQGELFYLKKYSSISQLKQEIKEYIIYYNNERIKSNLNKMSPIQYRAHYYQN